MKTKQKFNSKLAKLYYFGDCMIEKLARKAETVKDMKEKAIIYFMICDIIKKQFYLWEQRKNIDFNLFF